MHHAPPVGASQAAILPQNGTAHTHAQSPERASLVEAVRGEKPAVRVAAVIPGYGKHEDVAKLLRDLSRLDLTVGRRRIEFWAVLVDNNSPVPLSTVPVPANLRLEHHRLSENTGGAGGFNAGMARVIAGEGLSGEFDPPDFVWCVDSDARVSRRCLKELVKVLLRREDVCAAGSALVDTTTRLVYEIGGKISRNKGEWGPAHWGNHDKRRTLRCDYIAACCLLARRDAIEQTGLMPDIFIHGDDVLWSIRLSQKTGKKILGVPASTAFHPHFVSKFQTWTRYYGSRNSFLPLNALGMSGWLRFRKGIVETHRAVCQSVMAFQELADLHIDGLRDALEGKFVGHHPPFGRDNIIAKYKANPLAKLAQAVREERAKLGGNASVWVHPLLLSHPHDLPEVKRQVKALGLPTRVEKYWKRRDRFMHRYQDAAKAAWRLIAGPTADVAVVPTGWPTSWFRGRVLIQVTPQGFLIRDCPRWKLFGAAVRTGWRGLRFSWRLWAQGVPAVELPPCPVRAASRTTKNSK